MHDIDSTTLEAAPDYHESPDYQEFADEMDEFGNPGELSDETSPPPLTERDEEALAAELLGVSNEEEMDQFLGGLFKKISRGVQGAARFLSRNGVPVSGLLKNLAGRAMPFLGGALGSAIPIPGLGTAIGMAVGNAAKNFLQAETDHLEVEDREFQMARRFVRLASNTLRHGVRLPVRYNPTIAANLALRNAIQGLRRAGGFRQRTYYRSCPPCEPCPACPPPEPCPTCSQPLPAPNVTADPNSGGTVPNPNAPGGEPAPAPAKSEEFAYMGEAEGEGDTYETNYETMAPSISDSGRSGRWVRRGGKIILYGV